MTWPTYDSASYLRREALKYVVGGEKTETLVVDSTTVTLDPTTARRILPAGTVLCKITLTGKYGPYDGAANDGRETIAPETTFVLAESHDVTFGDQPATGYFQDCVFDTDAIVDAAGNLVSADGAAFALLQAALPGCSFR